MTLQTACTPQLIGPTVALSGFSYSSPVLFTLRNYSSRTNIPSFTTGVATQYAISPALPTGMSMDASTGYITGTPTVDTPAAATPAFTTYTVTASNSRSSVSTTVKLLVMNGFLVDSAAWDGTAATSDVSNGDGTCATPSSTCTLKAAIQEVNALGGVKSIFLSDGTYAPTSSVAPVGMTHLVLCGRSADTAIISGSNAIKVINANGGGGSNMTLCNVTIRDGAIATNGGAGMGFTSASATALINIFYAKFINNNNASSAFGAIGALGVDMSNAGGTVNIDHSVFESNSTQGTGGAIFHNTVGTINISNSTFQSNFGGTGAGALYIMTSGTINVSQSTFKSNSATVGGAIQVGGSGILRVLNSTFYSNSSTAGNGGAIDFASSGAQDIRFSTFFGNSASALGGAVSTSSSGPTLLTTANIFQGNTAGGSPGHCNAASGTWTGGGYTALSSGGGTCGSAGTGDVTTAASLIATTAAYNGGTVLNFALSSGSPAIDLVPLSACLDRVGSSLTTDTRGATRPSGSLCDSGAVEN